MGICITISDKYFERHLSNFDIISYFIYKHYLIFQSLDMNITSKSEILMQFIIPYLAVTIEPFIFCFAGEYLSIKVSMLFIFIKL